MQPLTTSGSLLQQRWLNKKKNAKENCVKVYTDAFKQFGSVPSLSLEGHLISSSDKNTTQLIKRHKIAQTVSLNKAEKKQFDCSLNCLLER